VSQAIERHGVSQRRACRILSQPRGTQRYRPSLRPDEDLQTQRIWRREGGAAGGAQAAAPGPAVAERRGAASGYDRNARTRSGAVTS